MATGCQSLNQSGRPCSAAVYQDGWCRWHHPDLGERRREWAKKGGANRSNKTRARREMQPALTAAELEQLVGQVLRDVVAGEVEPGVGNCVANLGRALASIRETVTLEERLTELERAAGIGEGRSA